MEVIDVGDSIIPLQIVLQVPWDEMAKGPELSEGRVLLRVSALHYSTRSWISEGFWTVASAHVLCLPTIVCLSISIISVQEFGD